MSQKEVKRLALQYLEACSAGDFDALDDIVASSVILWAIAYENEKTFARLEGRGLETLKEWLKSYWNGSLARPIATEDLAIQDSFIYVRYRIKTRGVGNVFHIADGKIAEIWIFDWYHDPESYISHFVAKLAEGGYDPSA